MDAAKDDVTVCKHCKKEVAVSNFELHEPHCQRFLCLCPDCGESVPRDQLDQHREDEHTQVQCVRCRKKMERRDLPDHETDECSERLKCCEFCELELPLSSLMEHSIVCGSRTERCADCGRYVTLKDQSRHAEICSFQIQTQDISDLDYDQRDDSQGDMQKKPPVQCDKCFKMVFSDSMEEHERVCDPSSQEEEDLYSDIRQDPNKPDQIRTQRSDFSMSDRRKVKESGWLVGKGGDGGDEISTCPYCHLALPIKTLQWHEVSLNGPT
ncbi:XIAP-associated factor 1 [Chanos chanos]|uniref:XIAP-associated factor 1 n=1 Tax=Chanos chanos TaxID=29144 RepID=A0A6J2VS40_CHACN|nr:XIAP-associated factor 1 [Chanos chanos]